MPFFGDPSDPLQFSLPAWTLNRFPRPCILSPPLWGPLPLASSCRSLVPCSQQVGVLPAPCCIEFGRQLQGCRACSRTASLLMARLQDGRPSWLSTNREMKNLSGKVLPPFRSHWETPVASQQFFLFLSPLGRDECHPKYCAHTWEGLGAFGQSKKNEKNIDPPGVRSRWVLMEYFKMC